MVDVHSGFCHLCDSSGSSNWPHSLFQSHPSAPRIPFPSGILIPRGKPALEEPEDEGKALERASHVPSSMLGGDTWGRSSRVSHQIPEALMGFQILPPDPRGTFWSQGGPGRSTTTFHTRFSMSNPLEQIMANSTKAGNDS